MITMSFGRPKIKLGGGEEMAQESMFNTKTLVLVGTGVALGIILKQQTEIHTLKRTVIFLQEFVR